MSLEQIRRRCFCKRLMICLCLFIFPTSIHLSLLLICLSTVKSFYLELTPLWHPLTLTMDEGVSSKRWFCMLAFMCLSRSSLVSKGQRGRPTFRGSNNNGVQPLCQQLQRAMFSQGSFHPYSPRCFFPLVKTHPGSEEHFPSLWPR